jgi:hypothetical protein
MWPQVHNIRYFSIQIKGPSPEMVEYIGMQNLINAIKSSVGLSEGKLLFGFKGIPFIALFSRSNQKSLLYSFSYM